MVKKYLSLLLVFILTAGLFTWVILSPEAPSRNEDLFNLGMISTNPNSFSLDSLPASGTLTLAPLNNVELV